jgi:hypothetical protein
MPICLMMSRRLDRGCRRTGQDHAVAETVDLDVGVRQRRLQRGAHAVEVALDGDVVGRDLLACGIEEHDVGLADCGADDIGALRGADHGVGDLGIGDQHILDVARQVDHDRFADAERKVARIHLSVGGNRRRGVVVARHYGRQDRIERQCRCGRKRQGADRQDPHQRLISPALHILRPFGHFLVVELGMPQRTIRARAIEPGTSEVALGRSLRRIKVLLAVATGQVGHRRSPGLTDRTSADCSGAIGSVGQSSLSNPLAGYAAMPSAPTALARATMRAVFIRFTFHITLRRFRRRDGS